MIINRLVSLAAVIAGGLSSLQAAVTLASPFTNHAVLQRGIEIPVWEALLLAKK
jgi:hypothetical protein